MGCTKSKENRVEQSLSGDHPEEPIKTIDVVRVSSSSSHSSGVHSNTSDVSVPQTPEDANQNTDSTLGIVSLDAGPTALESIPVDDMGESLDARRLTRAWQRSNSRLSTQPQGSAMSRDSNDSGIDELDDEYSFVITENSPSDLVEQVVSEFTPVENLDLTITGQPCPRLLSGYQKARQEEQRILESLREEGFLSSSRQKTAGGLSFDILEDSPLSQSAASGQLKPQDFMPQSHKEHLESRRNQFCTRSLTSADVSRRQFLAEERRKTELAAKLEKASALNRSRPQEDLSEELRLKKEAKANNAMEKREAYLKEMRDRVKAQNKRVQQTKLKKLLNVAPVPVPIGGGLQNYLFEKDDFFL